MVLCHRHPVVLLLYFTCMYICPCMYVRTYVSVNPGSWVCSLPPCLRFAPLTRWCLRVSRRRDSSFTVVCASLNTLGSTYTASGECSSELRCHAKDTTVYNQSRLPFPPVSHSKELNLSASESAFTVCLHSHPQPEAKMDLLRVSEWICAHTHRYICTTQRLYAALVYISLVR